MMPDNKSQIRNTVRGLRSVMGLEQKQQLSLVIQTNALSLPIYREAKVVMAYLNNQDEVQTNEIIKDILSSGKRLIVPYCQMNNIIPCEIFDIQQDIVKGAFGIGQPHSERLKPVDSKDIDVVFVPGIAFDHEGNRIGFGKGFYDRFLPTLRNEVPKIGLAFACQIIDQVQVDEHDYKMSLLITENGVIYPG